MDRRELHEAVRRFAEVEAMERQQGRDYYGKADSHAFEYYLIRRYQSHPHTVYTATRHYLSIVEDILRYLTPLHTTDMVVDAGSGIGTETMLLASLGFRVLGVDTMSDCVTFANHRVAFFGSRLGGPLTCEFVHGDVLAWLREAPAFAAVWFRESVSHIHPFEEALAGVRTAMPVGGRVFICEHNFGNPWVRRRFTAKVERNGHHLGDLCEFRDDATGKIFTFADERPFSLSSLRRILESGGWQVERARTRGFVPKTILSGVLPVESLRDAVYGQLDAIDGWLGAIWPFHYFGGTMLITAVRV